MRFLRRLILACLVAGLGIVVQAHIHDLSTAPSLATSAPNEHPAPFDGSDDHCLICQIVTHSGATVSPQASTVLPHHEFGTVSFPLRDRVAPNHPHLLGHPSRTPPRA